ncbi:MAG: diguanylate cyclase [Candidatus Kuenenia sp.]|nr:diguanylate cyclase [Candidatus Kuenenia hertensis]
MQKNVDDYNRNDLPYKVSLSFGIAKKEPHNDCTLDELIEKADALMYKHKQSKRAY